VEDGFGLLRFCSSPDSVGPQIIKEEQEEETLEIRVRAVVIFSGSVETETVFCVQHFAAAG
jgi:hypothetical protein